MAHLPHRAEGTTLLCNFFPFKNTKKKSDVTTASGLGRRGFGVFLGTLLGATLFSLIWSFFKAGRPFFGVLSSWAGSQMTVEADETTDRHVCTSSQQELEQSDSSSGSFSPRISLGRTQEVTELMLEVICKRYWKLMWSRPGYERPQHDDEGELCAGERVEGDGGVEEDIVNKEDEEMFRRMPDVTLDGVND